MLNQVAKRRGWEVSTDTHSDNSDKFTRDGESLVVYYDTVYQSVLYAGKAYGDMAELNHKSRKKKEKVRSWLNEPRKQTEYPDRPPTAPDSVPNVKVETETTHNSWGMPVEDKPKTTWNVVLFGPNRFSHVTVEAEGFKIESSNGAKVLLFGPLKERPDGVSPALMPAMSVQVPTHFYNMAYVVSWEKA